MGAEFHARFAAFDDDEAMSILGQPRHLQIAWPAPDVGGQFTPQDILELMIRRRLSVLRLPAPSARLIQSGVQWALWFALSDIEGAYRLDQGGAQGPPPNGQVEPILQAIDELLGLRDRDPRRFLLHTFEGEAQLVASLVEAGGDTGSTSGFFVDLEALGHRLAEHAGRPLLVLWSDQDLGFGQS